MPIYLPGAFVMLAQVAFINGVIGAVPSPIELRDMLDNLGEALFAIYFVLSAVALLQTYRTVRAPELRQQMKWVQRHRTGGSALLCHADDSTHWLERFPRHMWTSRFSL